MSQEQDSKLLARLDEKVDSLREDIQEIKGLLRGKTEQADLVALRERVDEAEEKINSHTVAMASASGGIKSIGALVGFASGVLTVIYHVLHLTK